jgi:hypothetical protein
MASGDIYTIDLVNSQSATITVDSMILTMQTHAYNSYEYTYPCYCKCINSTGDFVCYLTDFTNVGANSSIYKNYHLKIKINSGESLQSYKEGVGSAFNIYTRITLMEL